MKSPSRKIIYSRGFPYGAPLVMLRGGGLKVSGVRGFLREQGFSWNSSRYAWEHYLDRSDLGPILCILRESYGCEIVPKADMDKSYLLDLDDPKFGRPKGD